MNDTLFKWLAALVLLVFYGIYFAKMLIQRKKGIKTHQLGTYKDKDTAKAGKFVSLATLAVVAAQLVSIIAGWSMLPANARFTGFLLAMIGNVIFLISVYTMRDSWRAGIPATDDTQFVSGGIYAFSRNPAFLGFDFMYVGVLLLFFNPLLLVFSALAALSLHLQILQEERFLISRFGEPYREYKTRVFRYLGRK